MTVKRDRGKPVGDLFVAKEDPIYILYGLFVWIVTALLIFANVDGLRNPADFIRYWQVTILIELMTIFMIFTSWYFLRKSFVFDRMVLGEEELYYHGPLGVRRYGWDEIVEIFETTGYNGPHLFIGLRLKKKNKKGRYITLVARLEHNWRVPTQQVIAAMDAKRTSYLMRNNTLKEVSVT